MLIDPKGKIVNQANPDKEEVLDTSLSLEMLNKFRDKFKIGIDWDKFSIVS